MNNNNPIDAVVGALDNPYPIHTPVSYGGNVYYARGNLFTESALIPSPILTLAHLGNPNLFSSNQFFWRGNIGQGGEMEPRIIEFQFGDGYAKRMNDGINTQLLKFSIEFEGRTTHEAKGILHFLHEFGGVKSFKYTPPEPYNKEGLYICKDFKPKLNFFNNISISATFEQVPEL